MAISNKQRLELVEAYLREHQYADLHELAERFETSLSTIRRTLNDLEAAGVVRRHHGGASLLERSGISGYDFITQDDTNADQKRRLAAAVSTEIEDGQTVLIDGGTTTYAVAKAILYKRLIIITNSLPIAALLNEVSACETIVTGGTLYHRLGVLCGHTCESVLATMHADVAVLGCAGITADGIWNSNDSLAGYQRRMIRSASRTLFVADESKLGRRALTLSTPFSDCIEVFSTGIPDESVTAAAAEAGTRFHTLARATSSCY